jgi:hypothetical protein
MTKPGINRASQNPNGLKFLVKIARGARDVHSAWGATLAVFYALHNAGWLRALRAVRALRSVHHLLAVSSLSDLGHGSL